MVRNLTTQSLRFSVYKMVLPNSLQLLKAPKKMDMSNVSMVSL